MKTNKFFRWLYGVFMFLPILAIGVTCAYVTFNKNAKDSYYGDTINEVSYTDISVIETPNNYRFVNDNTLNQVDTNGSQYFSFTKIKDYRTNNNNVLGSLDYSDYQYCIMYFNNNYRTFGFVGRDSANTKYIQTRYFDYIDFENFSSASDLFIPYLKEPHFNKDSYLDNAFYYAVEQFNESGFNKVDFISYFDMFFNNTNIWTTFANTYMNYVLFVSLAFFIPRVLFWFINFSFSIVDSFTDKSKGW